MQVTLFISNSSSNSFSIGVLISSNSLFNSYCFNSSFPRNRRLFSNPSYIFNYRLPINRLPSRFAQTYTFCSAACSNRPFYQSASVVKPSSSAKWPLLQWPLSLKCIDVIPPPTSISIAITIITVRPVCAIPWVVVLVIIPPEGIIIIGVIIIREIVWRTK